MKHGNATHGMYGTSTYSSWASAKGRTTNKDHPQYKDYGGRGLQFYEPWLKFENFLKDMGKCPPTMSIDRLDNNIGYMPGNCRWATKKEQAINRRNVKLYGYLGKELTLADWSKELKVPRTSLYRLVEKGKSFDEILVIYS